MTSWFKTILEHGHIPKHLMVYGDSCE